MSDKEKKNMKPGRALDALVAEHVMGESFRDYPLMLTSMPPQYKAETPHYSNDIAAAWEVVNKMMSVDMLRKRIQYRGGFQVNNDVNGWSVGIYEEYAFGVSAPHAICLAALKAVGYDV